MKNKMYEHRCEQLETKAKESEAQLTQQVKEVESLLSESMKKIEELEVFSEVKVQSWKKKEQTFQHFINNQQYSVKVRMSFYLYFILFIFAVDLHVKSLLYQDLKMSSESIKQEVINCQKRWTDEISNFGKRFEYISFFLLSSYMCTQIN